MSVYQSVYLSCLFIYIFVWLCLSACLSAFFLFGVCHGCLSISISIFYVSCLFVCFIWFICLYFCNYIYLCLFCYGVCDLSRFVWPYVSQSYLYNPSSLLRLDILFLCLNVNLCQSVYVVTTSVCQYHPNMFMFKSALLCLFLYVYVCIFCVFLSLYGFRFVLYFCNLSLNIFFCFFVCVLCMSNCLVEINFIS